ncbi:hypothetical protein AAC387_Pa06g1603 [Persea americana]
MGPIDPAAYRSPSAKQPSIAKALSGKMGYARNRFVRAVGKFFFDGAIAPNKATSPYLKTMLDAAAENDPGIKPPTPYEIGHYCVEGEYKEAVDWVNTFRRIWRERGYTLMCDGWTTVTRRSLLNFLVYSSLWTVFIKSVDATEYVKDVTYLNKLFNEIIDKRWENQLHHDLHAAGYFFNPQYRYNENVDRSLTDEIRFWDTNSQTSYHEVISS